MSDVAADNLLSVRQVAAMLHVSDVAAWRLVDRGELPAMRIGRTIRIPSAAVYAYIEEAFNRSRPRTVEKTSGTDRQPRTTDKPRPTRTIVTPAGTVFENIA